MGKNTATGPDEIHPQFCKFSMTYSGQTISLNIGLKLLSSQSPNQEKITLTQQIITLTSCICKTTERIVNVRLIWYLKKHNILSRFQNGFRRNQVINDQLIRLETYICNGLIKNHLLVSISFDLENAYDTTWRYGILKDLHKTGIKGNMAAFIKNFLSHRTITVRHGNTNSDLYKQETGIPQSVFYLLHYLSSKSTASRNLSAQESKNSCIAIIYSSPNMPTLERQMQNCLNKIKKWTNENDFQF